MVSALSFVFLAAGLVALFAGAIWDLKERIIPDHLVIVVLAAGAALRLTSASVSWLTPVIGILVFLAMSFQAAHNIVGGGDAKMMTAVTFLFPPAHVALMLVMIALAGGILALAYVSARYALKAFGWERAPASTVRGFLRGEAQRAMAGAPLPFGFAIFAGVVSTVFLELTPCFSAISSSTFCSL